MTKLPAIQFYPADWRKDPGVQSLDYFDRGVWFELLLIMHEAEERGKLVLNNRAMTTGEIAAILHLPEETFSKTLTTLLNNGVAKIEQNTNKIYNKRMVDDDAQRRQQAQQKEHLRAVRAEAGRKSAEQRANKRQQKQAASSSSSSSSSSSKEDQQRAKRAPVSRGTRLPDDFTVTPEMRTWASANTPHVDPDRVLPEFRDYWNGIPGAKGRKLDWPGTFRNRLRDLEARGNGGGSRLVPEHPNAYRPGKMVL